MSVLRILRYPDPMLSQTAAPVPQVDGSVCELVYEMMETMRAERGVGLAAPQVGKLLRIFIVDIWWPETDREDQTLVFINPEWGSAVGRPRSPEGCLSLPGVYEHVTRAAQIKIRALNLEGESFVLDADGFLAVAIQHEMDHLDGVVLLDRLSPFARKLALRKARPQSIEQ